MITPEQIRTLAPYVALALLACALLAFLLAGRLFRRSRKDVYWRLRRQAGQRGWRISLVGTVFLIGAIFAGMVAVIAQVAYRPPLATAVAVAESGTPEASPDFTPDLTPTDSVLPTATLEKPSETPFAMPIMPSVTPTEVILTEVIPTDVIPTDVIPTDVIPTDVIPSAVPASPTPTISPTATLTMTPSATASETSSPTPPPTDTPTRRPTSQATALPTDVPLPTRVPPTPTATSILLILSETPTPTRTITVTASPAVLATATETPSPTLDPVSLTGGVPTTIGQPLIGMASPTLESSVTPAANARLSIYALDTLISGDNAPVNPGRRFAPGFPRIYVFCLAENLQRGVLWRRELWRGTALLQANEYLWGTAGSGPMFFFFGIEGGFPAGQYEVRIYIGRTEKPAVTAGFEVGGN